MIRENAHRPWGHGFLPRVLATEARRGEVPVSGHSQRALAHTRDLRSRGHTPQGHVHVALALKGALKQNRLLDFFIFLKS